LISEKTGFNVKNAQAGNLLAGIYGVILREYARKVAASPNTSPT
jgi:hypothetical protein